MKRITFLLAFLVTVSITLANFKGLPKEVDSSLNVIQKYSKYSSFLFWCGESYTLNTDGSQSYEWHSFRYFRDESARDAWGDPRINYSDNQQKVEILRARTYTSDGKTIDCTPENAYNPVVPDGMDLAPDFSEYRQLVVTLLGLENGSISEFHYKVTTQKPLLPWLEGRVFFREEYPVLARELTVQIPSGNQLTFQVDRGVPEPSVDGGRYVWKMRELNGYLGEDLASQRELLPNVSFSTAQDWEEICSFLSKRIETANSQVLVIPSSLDEALAGQTSVGLRFDAIKQWVRARFLEKHFDHPDFALTLRPSHQVMNTGYGNGLEMAALVKGLAKVCGIDCEILPRFVIDPSVPSLLGWADPVLALNSDFNFQYVTDPLVPRSEVARELSSSFLFDLSTCMKHETPVWTNRDSKFSVMLSLSNLDQDSTTGQGSLIADGEWFCVEAIQEDGAEKYLKSLIVLPGFTCASARVKELKSSGIVSMDFEFTLSSLDTADGFRVLPLSAFDFRDFFDGAPFGLPSREFQQEIPYIGEVSLQLEADIPDKWEITSKADDSMVSWNAGSGDVRCEVKDDRTTYKRSLNFTGNSLSSSDWGSFRTWIVESGPRPNNCIVFQRSTTPH